MNRCAECDEQLELVSLVVVAASMEEYRRHITSPVAKIELLRQKSARTSWS
jgi:hypothetical protein